MAILLGLSKSDSKGTSKTYKSDTPEYFQQFVDSWYRYRRRFENEWSFIDREYNIGRDVRDAHLPFDPMTPLGQGPLITPARLYSLVHIIEAEILGNRPKFFLEGFTAEEEERYRMPLETALNNDWNQNYRLYREARLCVRDAAKKGFGVMLSSYEDEVLPDDTERQRARELSQLDPVLGAAGAEQRALDAQEAARGAPEDRGEREGDSRRRVGSVTSLRVSPWSFLMDPDARLIEQSRICGRLIVVDYETFMQDDLMKHKDQVKPITRSELRKRISSKTYETDYVPSDADELPYQSVLLYELFHRRPGGTWDLAVVPTEGSFFCRYEPDYYWIGNPYKTLQWNDDGEGFIPMSDAQAVASEIVAERHLMTKLYEGYAREHSDVTFYDSSLAMTETNLDEITQSAVSRYVPVDNFDANQNPGGLQSRFFRPPKEPKSPDAVNILRTIQASIEVSSGASPNTFGQALKSGTTATEAANVEARTRGRGSHKLAAMEEFLSAVAYDRLGLMAQNYDAEDIIRLAGNDAGAAWEEAAFTRADVKEKLQVMIEVGSTQPKSQQSEINKLMALLQMGLNNPVGQQLINLPEIIKDLTVAMGFKDGTKYLNLQDPAEVQNVAATLLANGVGATGGGGGGLPSEAAQEGEGI